MTQRVKEFWFCLECSKMGKHEWAIKHSSETGHSLHHFCEWADENRFWIDGKELFGEAFDGAISEFKIHGRALTPAEIKMAYTEMRKGMKRGHKTRGRGGAIK